jgi:alpha/beta superfamily hydrolase
MGRAGSQQEERAVTIPLCGGPEALEGIYVAGGTPEAPGAVIAPPHPLYGGSLDSPVLNELAWACRKCGLASLRFNWRGVGASAGTRSGDERDADADYISALEYLGETQPGQLVASGYSFGAASALRVGIREPRVRRLVLVSPPPALLDGKALESFEGQVLILTGEQDALAPVAELEALAARSGAARLVVVPEADHFFAAGLADISRETALWLDQGPGARARAISGREVGRGPEE